MSDARVIITDVEFNGLKLDYTFVEQAIYTHDFNGTKQQQQARFYGEMGCNGTVSLEFSTPCYLWLLENLEH